MTTTTPYTHSDAYSDPAVSWLLMNNSPSVRYLTLTDLLGISPDDPQALAARSQIMDSEPVKTLLAGQVTDGGFGVHPYQKWRGAHWRLVSLVEMGIPDGEPHALAALEQVLSWLSSPHHQESIICLNGLWRRCASQEGNALAVACRLGMSQDKRVQRLAEKLLEWQWPDGGWNCRKDKDAHHSSFYETLSPFWGLIEYYKATVNLDCLAGAQRAAEFFLRHNMFRSERKGKVINPEWLLLHYPLYWHYDILQGMTILSRLHQLSDARLAEALSILETKRRPDGLWHSESYYWSLAPSRSSQKEVVNWGRGGPNPYISLNALRVLKSAGRWQA